MSLLSYLKLSLNTSCKSCRIKIISLSKSSVQRLLRFLTFFSHFFLESFFSFYIFSDGFLHTVLLWNFVRRLGRSHRTLLALEVLAERWRNEVAEISDLGANHFPVAVASG